MRRSLWSLITLGAALYSAACAGGDRSPTVVSIVPSRPAHDQVAFTLQTSRLAAAPDGQGGYVLADNASVPRFHLLPPTATAPMATAVLRSRVTP